LFLQERGLAVTAIDNSPGAIELCRLRGIDDARIVDIADVASLDGAFDTVLMLGSNFGLFGGFHRAKLLLKKLACCTDRNAQIIAQTRDPYKTTEPTHLAYHNRNRRMGGQVRMRVRYKEYATPWMDYLFVSEAELKVIVDDTGWGIEEITAGDGPVYFARLKKTNTA
jgi:hypothetical protein